MKNPYKLFQNWFDEAQEKELDVPEAMTISSVNENGFPSSRVVLLKKIQPKMPKDGFVFFTNIDSQKSKELISNPKTALCFHWKSLTRQVRIRGLASVLHDKEADDYFLTRPRDSQISAWASKQSMPLESMDFLKKEFDRFTEQFEEKQVPRPPYWSGFRVRPDYFEFWEGRPSRLHERLSYTWSGNSWDKQLLFP